MSSVFSFRALEPSGTEVQGELQCADRRAALDMLHRKGLIPVEVTTAAVQAGRQLPASKSRSRPRSAWLAWQRQQLTLRDWLDISQSLAALFRAGLPVDRALQIAHPLARTPAGREIITRLLESVREGVTLSEALARHGRGLPEYFTSMVSAGEAGGALPAAMDQLVTLVARQVGIRERLRSALIYPALLALMVVVTLIVLLVFVLPRFDVLFTESTAVLPWSTRLVLAMGHGVSQYWWLGLGLLAGGGIWLLLRLRSGAGRQRFDEWMLRSRFTLGLPASMGGARLLRTVGSLCRGGQPLPAALQIAEGTLSNRGLRAGLKQVICDVQAGASLSQSLVKAGVFPPVAVQMSRVGEETGQLEQMLQAAADVLEEESQRRLERLVTLAVPLLTIVMGLIVALLIGSVLVGLLSINDLAM